MKPIEIAKHFIKEKLDSGLIYTPYVSTNHQLVDILTKGLSSIQVGNEKYLFTSLRGSVEEYN